MLDKIKYPTLDYTIESSQDRVAYVTQICADPAYTDLTAFYLEAMADYILFAATKEERRERKILTENRVHTIAKRETSYQNITSKYESGEDAIYNLFHEDRNMILSPKTSISPRDRLEVPGLQQLYIAILSVEEQLKRATGRDRYLLKKAAIELRQDQYILKDSYRCTFSFTNIPHDFFTIPFNESIYIDPETAEPYSVNNGITFFNPHHLLLLLNNYSALKEDAYGNFTMDLYYLMEDLDTLVESALPAQYPMLYDLLIWKIDGIQNAELQSKIEQLYGIHYTIQYISALWCKKIPRLLAEKAKENYILWYYTYQERGKWKRCNGCGQIKLVHPYFFSKNSASADGFYSLCKECRSAREHQRRMHKKNKKNLGHSI